MTHALGIVAHTARAEHAQQLAATTNADYLSMDTGTLGCDGNHRKVWQHLAELDTEWSIILEDDAIPCNNWHDNLTQALTLAPTPIVSFYLGTSNPTHWQRFIRTAITRAEQHQAAWIVGPALIHAVAYAMRTELIAPFLAHHTQQPIDQAITTWARGKHQVAYTHPSMVDHRDEPTLFAHPDGMPRSKPRVAHRHGQPQWNTRTVNL